jgi:hypothetical protein
MNAVARDGIAARAERYVALSRLKQNRVTLAERHLRRAEPVTRNVWRVYPREQT